MINPPNEKELIQFKFKSKSIQSQKTSLTNQFKQLSPLLQEIKSIETISKYSNKYFGITYGEDNFINNIKDRVSLVKSNYQLKQNKLINLSKQLSPQNSQTNINSPDRISKELNDVYQYFKNRDKILEKIKNKNRKGTKLIFYNEWENLKDNQVQFQRYLRQKISQLSENDLSNLKYLIDLDNLNPTISEEMEETIQKLNLSKNKDFKIIEKLKQFKINQNRSLSSRDKSSSNKIDFENRLKEYLYFLNCQQQSQSPFINKPKIISPITLRKMSKSKIVQLSQSKKNKLNKFMQSSSKDSSFMAYENKLFEVFEDKKVIKNQINSIEMEKIYLNDKDYIEGNKKLVEIQNNLEKKFGMASLNTIKQKVKLNLSYNQNQYQNKKIGDDPEVKMIKQKVDHNHNGKEVKRIIEEVKILRLLEKDFFQKVRSIDLDAELTSRGISKETYKNLMNYQNLDEN